MDRGPIVDSAVFGFAPRSAPSSRLISGRRRRSSRLPADIEGAKALLAEAGYPDGFDTMITSWAQYSFLSNAVVIQEQLKQIGVNAELNLVENATMIADVHTPASKNYELGSYWYLRLHRSAPGASAVVHDQRFEQRHGLLESGRRR
ncbi:MAG: ABC transporter substrate-binding protein [Thermomicrobiales bacterium]